MPLIHPFKVPGVLLKLFPGLEWRISTSEKAVFLTFDDGPHPEITQWVLEQLDHYNAKATFFCVGENVSNYPETAKNIQRLGHAIGNHTHNHLKGWKTSDLEYVKNTVKASQHVQSKLFRPPYGRITRNQINLLKAKGYRIIMWNLLSCDYSQHLNTDKALQALIKNTTSGSIVVFHDSVKASSNVKQILPTYLQFLKDNGYKCLPIV